MVDVLVWNFKFLFQFFVAFRNFFSQAVYADLHYAFFSVTLATKKVSV